MSTVNDDFEYKNFETVSNDSSQSRNYIERKFIWIQWLLMYLPMWIPVNNDKHTTHRNKYLSVFVLLSASIISLHHLIFFCWWIVHVDGSDSNGLSLYQITNILYQIGITLIRGLSMYYFVASFKYPFKTYIDHFERTIYSDVYNDHAVVIHKWNKLITITALVFFVANSFNVFLHVRNFAFIEDDTLRISSLIAVIFGRIFVYWPIYICGYLSCCIFVKYYVYMMELLDIVSTTTMNQVIQFDVLFEKYKAVRNRFKRDYHPYLKTTVEIYLILQLFDIWSSYNILKISADEWIVGYALIVADVFYYVTYGICASLVTDSFEKFEKLVWTYCENNRNQGSIDQNFLLNYIIRHPLVVKVGNFKISRKNSIKFIAAYATTKFISYVLRTNVF